MSQETRSAIKGLLPSPLKRLWFPYESQIYEEILDNCETVLDVGCGSASPIAPLSSRLKYVVGVDIHRSILAQSKQEGIHHQYIELDAVNIGKVFAPKTFDCVLALDLIEHLSKAEGFQLLEAMEKVAVRKVIVFTPNGFVSQPAQDGNPWQKHLSGWRPHEMRAQGYRVYGIHGWRYLRGEAAAVRHKPWWLWELISRSTQFLFTNRPQSAYQLLCVKDVRE